MPDCYRCLGAILRPLLDECQPGDMQVRALYNPSRQIGRITGRQYPRTLGVGQTICVAPSDVQAAPELWQVVSLAQENSVLSEAGLI